MKKQSPSTPTASSEPTYTKEQTPPTSIPTSEPTDLPNSHDGSVYDIFTIKKSPVATLAIIIVTLVVSIFVIWLFSTEDKRSNTANKKAYELVVKNSLEDSGFRQETKILTYLYPPSNIVCENVVVQKPKFAYRQQSDIPAPGDVMTVYFEPDAECSRNGQFIGAIAQKNSAERTYDLVGRVILYCFVVLLVISTILGLIYAHIDRFRIFYLKHRYLGKIQGLMWFVWLTALCLFIVFGFFALNWWQAIGLAVIMLIFYGIKSWRKNRYR